jgi:hypothetical protein
MKTSGSKMPSGRFRPSYLLVDHSQSPGMAPADMAPGFAHLAVAAGRKFEASVTLCAHCQGTIVLGLEHDDYCRKCDRFICDLCALAVAVSGEHKSFDQFADEYLEAASRERPLPILGGTTPHG